MSAPSESSESPDPLRRAAPPVDDVEARRARASIASRLFSGPRQPVHVGRYRVQSRIGAGGMGVVYRAHDPELARDVAVKLMNAATASTKDPATARARLVREARAMARLAHPNVIQVYDVGTVEDGVFIAMELVEGQNLAAWREESQPPWREVLRKYIDAGRGLSAAHAAGVVHRDFKPENVLVGDDDRVRVVDFGLAGGPAALDGGSQEGEIDRDTDDLQSLSGSLTQTGTLLGTPKYMAPEQETGTQTDARSDQFSFCVALYEALHGHPPFSGTSVTEYRRNVHAGLVLSPAPDSKVRAWVHAEIVRGLAVDPIDRHEGLAPLLDRLEEVLVDPNIARRRRRRARVIATLGGTAALLLGGVGLWVAIDDSPAATAAPTVIVQTSSPLADADAGPTAASPATAAPTDGAALELDASTSGEGGASESATDSGDSTGLDGTDSTTTGPEPAAASKRKRPLDSCYFVQDRWHFIRRHRRHRRFVAASDGACWDCENRAEKYRIPKLNPQDCGRYYKCVAVSEDQCQG